MKKVLNSLFITAFTSMMLLFAPASKVQAQDVTVSYQDFYDELSPYGQWVYDPDYGNVWVPNEDQSFRPYYSRGHWVMTDYGNMWASDDPWGWATYHYGRWTYNGYYGWIWVPGYEWAPAWVSWRYGGGYAGWAPLSPGISVGMSYGCPDSWWVFVGPQYLYTPNYYNYWRGPGYNRTYINQTTIINNVYVDNHTHVQYNYGPRASTIQATTHAPVQVYRVSQGNRPGVTSIQRNTVSVYRPNVNRNTYTTARPQNVVQAPRNIGRPEAAVPQGGGNRQPAFRQDVQRGNVTPMRGTPPQPARTPNNPANRFDQRPTQGRQEPMRNQPQEPVRQEPMRNNPQPQQPVRQEPQRFEPQRNNPQPQQPVRQEPQRQQDRPEPQRFEPQRNNPQPQQPARQEPQRFEPQRNNPQPQQPMRQEPQRFEPQRSNPQPQPQRMPEQPRPQMQQPRPQPAPAPAPRPQPQQQEQRGGGRR